MKISEKTVNKFFKGTRIEYVSMYEDAVHIQCDNNAMLTMTEIDGEIVVGILGPNPPEREQMRDLWEAE